MVLRPMNSGRWNAAPSVESPLSTRLLPMLNRSPLDATMAKRQPVVVGQVVGRLVVALEFRHQHAGHVEDVPLVGQRIAAVAAAVGRVASRLAPASMLFCSGASSMACDHVYVREEFVPARQLLAQRDIQAVVGGSAHRFRGGDVAEARVVARRFRRSDGRPPGTSRPAPR